MKPAARPDGAAVPKDSVTALRPLLGAAGGDAAPRPGRRHLGGYLVRALWGSPLTAAAAVAVAGWLMLAIGAPLIAPYSPLQQDIGHRLAPPNWAHWAGTDTVGRDMLSRVIYGARVSIPVGVISVSLAVVLGTLIGSAAGFLGGLTDEVLMRATDVMLAFPTVIMAMVITAAMGPGIRDAVIAIMVAWWPSYARLTRGTVLSVREREYVDAARSVGVSPGRILFRHVVPNAMSPTLVLGTLDVGQAILVFASLSFLGLGPPPEIPEWGSMIATGRNYLNQWWLSAFPGLALLTLVVALNLVGDGIRDAVDPRLRDR
jgi:peptide/nickel transport system permease protein